MHSIAQCVTCQLSPTHEIIMHIFDSDEFVAHCGACALAPFAYLTCSIIDIFAVCTAAKDNLLNALDNWNVPVEALSDVRSKTGRIASGCVRVHCIMKCLGA